MSRSIYLHVIAAENGFIVRVDKDPGKSSMFGENEYVAPNEKSLQEVLAKILEPVMAFGGPKRSTQAQEKVDVTDEVDVVAAEPAPKYKPKKAEYKGCYACKGTGENYPGVKCAQCQGTGR